MNRGTPSPLHICFYSNRCEWSKAFITEISQTSYHKEFRFICVEPSPNRPQLPSWLKQTPTLVISGEAEPRTNSDVMNWFYERKMKDGAGGNEDTPINAEPEPYLDTEMGSCFGDSYSFLGEDTSAEGNGGTQMKHNFTYLNGNDSIGTKEASSFQTTNSNQKRNKKEEMLDQQYEQMMKSRDNGMPKSIARQ
jgi:hypothetical protein